MNSYTQIKKRVQNEPDFRKALARESLFWFFTIYFPHYITHPTADFQREMVSLFQDERESKVVITSFRGSAKSTLASLVLPIWAMVGRASKNYILVVSQTQELSRQILTNIKQEFSSNELLKRDFGPFSEVADEWRANSLVIPQYNTRIIAISQSESVRGLRHLQYRPDLVIVDDVEDQDSVRTREGREKLWQWFTGEIIPIGNIGTRIIVVGNLLHEDSLMMRLKDIIESRKMNGTYREYPLLDDFGNIAWPGKYPNMEAIEALRREVADESAWYREYLLKIIADEDRVIKSSWIKYYDTLPDPEKHPAWLVAVGVDLAISQSESANFTALVSAYVVGYGDNLRVYILPDIVNKRLNFPGTIQTIKSLTSRLRESHGIYPRVYIESVAYQRAAAQQLMVERVLAEEVKIPHTDKRSRLSVISPYVQMGKVLFPRKDAELLINQLLNFGVEKYDDLVDAFTILISKIIESDRPTRKPISQRKADPSYPEPIMSESNLRSAGFEPTRITTDMKF